MSGVISIQPGEPYNLTLQLHDGEDSLPKRVLCDLRRADQTLLGSTFELPARGGGLFQEDARTFPTDGTEEIFAFFRVMESDGVTESEIHARAVDRYRLLNEVNVQIPETIIPKQKSITANVRRERIKADVKESDRIVATVDKGENLTGEIKPNERLEGAIKTDGRLEANVRE
jgi:hypothetical protein